MAETRIGDIELTGDITRLWVRVRALEDTRALMDDRILEARVQQATRELRAELEELQERVSTLEGDTVDAPSRHPPPVRIGPN